MLETVLADGAVESLRRGDAVDHNRRRAEAVASLSGLDALLLAHFCTSRAMDTVRTAVDIPS